MVLAGTGDCVGGPGAGSGAPPHAARNPSKTVGARVRAAIDPNIDRPGPGLSPDPGSPDRRPDRGHGGGNRASFRIPAFPRASGGDCGNGVRNCQLLSWLLTSVHSLVAAQGLLWAGSSSPLVSLSGCWVGSGPRPRTARSRRMARRPFAEARGLVGLRRRGVGGRALRARALDVARRPLGRCCRQRLRRSVLHRCSRRQLILGAVDPSTHAPRLRRARP